MASKAVTCLAITSLARSLFQLNHRPIARTDTHTYLAAICQDALIAPEVLDRRETAIFCSEPHANRSIFARWVCHPKKNASLTFVQPGLHIRVVHASNLANIGHVEKSREKALRNAVVVQIVAGAWERPHKKGPTASESVLNCGNRAVLILASGSSAIQRIRLAEIPAIDLRTSHRELQLILDVGHELDIALARTKHFIQAEVRLYGSDVAMIAKVAR